MNFRQALGVMIKKIRLDIGCSQEVVADVVGVTQSTWARKEKGLQEMSVSQLVDFAEYAAWEPGRILDSAERIWLSGAGAGGAE